MVTLVINSTKRTFVTAGVYLAAVAAGIAMSKAMRAGKSDAENFKKIRAMAKTD